MNKTPVFISAVLCLAVLFSFSSNSSKLSSARHSLCWNVQAENITVRKAEEKELKKFHLSPYQKYYVMEADITNYGAREISVEIYVNVEQTGKDDGAVYQMTNLNSNPFPTMPQIPAGCTAHVKVPFEVIPEMLEGNQVYLELDSGADAVQFEAVELPD